MSSLFEYIPAKKTTVFLFFFCSILLSGRDIYDAFIDAVLENDWSLVDDLRPRLKQQCEKDAEQVRFVYYLGFEQLHRENYPEALSYYWEARNMAKANNRPALESELSARILEIIFKIEYFDPIYLDSAVLDKKKLIEDVCAYGRANNALLELVDCHYYQGMIFENQKAYKRALEHYQRSDSVALAHKDSLVYFNSILNTAYVQNKIGQHESALRKLFLVDSFYNTVHTDVLQKHVLYCDRAEVYIAMQNYPKAEGELLATLQLIREHKMGLEERQRAHELLATVYEKSEDLQKSMRHAKKAKALSDSITSRNHSGKLVQFLNDQRLAKANRDKQILRKKIFANRGVFGCGLVVLLGILVWGYFLVKRLKKRNAQKIVELNKEKERILAKLNALRKENAGGSKTVHLKSKAVLQLDQILYVKCDNHYLDIHLKGKTRPEVELNSLKAFLELLPSNQFIQTHRSYIVNVYEVKQMNSKWFTLSDGSKVPISRSFKPMLKNYFNTMEKAVVHERKDVSRV